MELAIMITSKTRRAVLAGAASLPALAAPRAFASIPSADPIFAAIERHKSAYRHSMECGRISVHTNDVKSSPGYDPVLCKAVLRANDDADHATTDAAFALTTIRPTTMAGILALIHYVEAFNAGAFFLEPNPGAKVDDWRSAPMFWPETKDDDEIDLFGYAVLANIRCALEAMAVQS
jgi:hypothetical protein